MLFFKPLCDFKVESNSPDLDLALLISSLILGTRLLITYRLKSFLIVLVILVKEDLLYVHVRFHLLSQELSLLLYLLVDFLIFSNDIG
jgi:hypothetical protein